MRIQHNIAALNSYRQLSGNNSAVSKNLEKLSSGYRINRAGDDAAGLAISEKMRAQITGLETAQKNANDGISLVQTAEGALTEVHSMLNRMVELATQSANGTYDESVDRNNLQKEFDSLLDEIDRISEATNFNGINLLDGSLGGAKVTSTAGTAAAATANATATITGTETRTVTYAAGTGGGTAATLTIDLSNVQITKAADGNTDSKATLTIGDKTISFAVAADKTTEKNIVDAFVADNGGDVNINGVTGKFSNVGDKLTFITTATGADSGVKLANLTEAKISTKAGTAASQFSASKVDLNFEGRTGADLLGGTVKIGNKTYSFVEDAAKAAAGTEAVILTKNDDSTAIADALKTKITAADAGKYTATITGNKNATVSIVQADADKANWNGKEIGIEFKGTGLRLQVGDTDADFQKVRVAVGDMSTKGLGLDTLKNVGIAKQTAAGTSIDKIKAAINTVSSTRGDLGAIQNRLEHTINNLGVTTENMTAAESRIRDTDMAQEMMSYTKNNILVQAAQAMLAQANQVPQGVLQLLQ